jgi:formiminotetrahydrofolate cyclodeaminase
MSKAEGLWNLSVREFIDAVASKQPTPGGGSVAGVAGGLAVALARMTIEFTRGKKKFAEHEPLYERVMRRLERAGEMFRSLTSDDAEAFTMIQAASKGQADMQLAVAMGTNVPREMSKLALSVLEDLLTLADKCNPYLRSDLTGAAALAAATVRLGDYCVAINVPQLEDAETAREIRTASQADVRAANQLLETIELLSSRQG